MRMNSRDLFLKVRALAPESSFRIGFEVWRHPRVGELPPEGIDTRWEITIATPEYYRFSGATPEDAYRAFVDYWTLTGRRVAAVLPEEVPTQADVETNGHQAEAGGLT